MQHRALLCFTISWLPRVLDLMIDAAAAGMTEPLTVACTPSNSNHIETTCVLSPSDRLNDSERTPHVTTQHIGTSKTNLGQTDRLTKNELHAVFLGGASFSAPASSPTKRTMQPHVLRQARCCAKAAYATRRAFTCSTVRLRAFKGKSLAIR